MEYNENTEYVYWSKSKACYSTNIGMEKFICFT